MAPQPLLSLVVIIFTEVKIQVLSINHDEAYGVEIYTNLIYQKGSTKKQMSILVKQGNSHNR
uniref:Putative ovule protein n=1 Tax=Solanum chacoense TaxID=4108 RepID=A0A0V0GEK8_SOLCH